jgi:hypothetical protein
VIAARELNLLVHLFDRLSDSATEVAFADAVLDRDIALVPFPVDFRTFVPLFDLAELRERNTLTRGASKRTFSIASFVLRNLGR